MKYTELMYGHFSLLCGIFLASIERDIALSITQKNGSKAAAWQFSVPRRAENYFS